MRARSGLMGSLALLMLIATPAISQQRPVRASIGYALAAYLEEGGGSAPVGAYISIASAGGSVGVEGDLAYHRDSEFGIVLNTVIAVVGPRFAPTVSGSTKPFLHALGGVRYDNVEGSDNAAFGGSAGGGVDIPAGTDVFVRVGADFQIFFDEGTNLKTLRVAVGVAF